MRVVEAKSPRQGSDSFSVDKKEKEKKRKMKFMNHPNCKKRFYLMLEKKCMIHIEILGDHRHWRQG